MNSAPSSMGSGTLTSWRVKMRPPMRWRASRMAIVLPDPERSRAAASPAAPPPMMITSTRSDTSASFADDFGPRKLAHLLHLLVDLRLSGLFAEDAAEVVDFRGDELIVLRQEADGGAL